MKLPTSGVFQKLYLFFRRYILFAVIIGVGVLIIFWPDGGSGGGGGSSLPGTEYPAFSLEEMEAKLEGVLERIAGTGRVKVLLTLQSDMEVVLAKDSESRQVRDMEGGELRSGDSESSFQNVIIGSGTDESPIITQIIYPLYRGALVVCDGGGDPKVKLMVLEAVAALTGLGGDKITVTAMGS